MKDLLIPAGTAFLLSGLVWRPLPPKSTSKEIRNTALERGATSFVQIGKAGSAAAYYAIFNEQETARKNIYSLAVVLSKLAAGDAAAVILQYEDSYAVACVNKNTPIIDEVFKDKTAAINALEPIAKRLGLTPKVNFDAGNGFDHVESLAVRLLGPKKGRVPSAKEIPKSILPQVILALVALGGTYWYYDHNEKEKARIEAERLAAEREADPVPKYMRQLTMDEPNFALTDSTVLKMLGDIAVVSQKPKGWEFDEANCGIDKDTNIQSCELQFKRADGVYSTLKSELSNYAMKFTFPADLNVAKATLEYKDESFKFVEYTKTAEQFLEQDIGDRAQDWLTAGLGLEITPPVLWPLATGVPQNFRHPMAKMVGELKVSKLPLYLVADLLNTKPRNSFVRTFKIKAQESEKKMDAEASVDLRYYVQQ